MNYTEVSKSYDDSILKTNTKKFHCSFRCCTTIITPFIPFQFFIFGKKLSFSAVILVSGTLAIVGPLELKNFFLRQTSIENGVDLRLNSDYNFKIITNSGRVIKLIFGETVFLINARCIIYYYCIC